jgi:DNA-directed RNA polymerase II subunit RPB2
MEAPIEEIDDAVQFVQLVPQDDVDRQVQSERAGAYGCPPIPRIGPNLDQILVSLDQTPAGKLLQRYLHQEGFGDHHIEVYDKWICDAAYNNIYSRYLRLPNDLYVRFERLRIFPPRYTRDNKILPLTPKLAREQGVTYGGDWHVDVVVRRGHWDGEVVSTREGVCIGMIPTMLKSRNCILHNKSPQQLAQYGEDPNDPGGYFIVRGDEKVVLLQERLSTNRIFLMSMDNKGSVVARMTANTPRGTALIELATDKKTHMVIKIRFPSMRSISRDEKSSKTERYKSLNVLRIFRIFGIGDTSRIQMLITRFIKPEYRKKSMLKLTRNLVDFLIEPDDIGQMMKKMDKLKLSPEERMIEVQRILDTDLFPHLNNYPGIDGETVAEREARIAGAKIDLLAIMVARFLEYKAGYRALDDRDSWSNKRVEGAGRAMEQLARNAWRKTVNTIQREINSGQISDLNGVVDRISKSVITETFRDSFIGPSWGVKGTQLTDNVAQTLVRDSVVATFAHINTVDVKISRTDRQIGPRLVQLSQWGLIDPTSTPEGENAGILKNLAITAKVSLERSDTDILRLLIGDPGKRIPSRILPSEAPDHVDKIMVNGKFLGWCNGEQIRRFLIDLRRSNAIALDVSIIREDDWITVDLSPSRLVRPLLIVDPDQQLAIDRLNLREAPNHILFSMGAMEYLSSWEQESIDVKIAISIEDIQLRIRMIEDADTILRDAEAAIEAIQAGEIIRTTVDGQEVILTLEEAQRRRQHAADDVAELQNNKPYTHCEIHPRAILGVAADLIPWPDHNQAPRNTFQVSMGKQALGIYHNNHANRFDGKTKILSFPTVPMVSTEMYDVIGLDVRGPGENASVAFLSMPYTEEDAFIFKREFLERGGFRIVKYLTFKTIVRHASDIGPEVLTRPTPFQGEPPGRYKYIQYGGIDSPINGLPMIGAPLRQGDCVIGKVQKIIGSQNRDDLRNESVFLKVGEEGIVDKVLVTTDNRTTVVKVKLRISRIPQEGDKFAPRNAQKGTIGLIMSDIDMPVSDEGLVPDIVVNSQSIPSRMTLAYIMELHAGKHGALRGVQVNGSAFAPFQIDTYRQTMRAYGLTDPESEIAPFLDSARRFKKNEYRKILREKRFREFGYEKMFSGTSGMPLEATIYVGPVFFQALKHHVKDKVQVRGTGPVKPQTHQPAKGRANRGGLRFGEMERDACISHGASAFLRERLMKSSDAYKTAFCKNCGTFAVYTETGKDGVPEYKQCSVCGQNEFGKYTIPYGYKLLEHLLAAPGINLRLFFHSSAEHKDAIFNQRRSMTTGNIDEIREQLEDADEGLGDEMVEDQDEDQDFHEDDDFM